MDELKNAATLYAQSIELLLNASKSQSTDLVSELRNHVEKTFDKRFRAIDNRLDQIEKRTSGVVRQPINMANGEMRKFSFSVPDPANFSLEFFYDGTLNTVKIEGGKAGPPVESYRIVSGNAEVTLKNAPTRDTEIKVSYKVPGIEEDLLEIRKVLSSANTKEELLQQIEKIKTEHLQSLETKFAQVRDKVNRVDEKLIGIGKILTSEGKA